jgi:hypothetical protein
MRVARLILLCGAIGLVAPDPPAAAQAAPGDGGAGARAAMDRLAFLVGEWEGDASMQRGPGTPERYRQAETVTREAGGTVLAIRGVGSRLLAGAEPAAVVHDAFAVITWDGARYRMRSHLADGRSGEFEVTLRENGLTWESPGPGGGRIRYLMDLTPAGEWVETGAWSADGATWRQFLEMKLRRR